MGRKDEISELRRFPVYAGRFQITWIINNESKTVTLLECIDSKYPRNFSHSFPTE
jgi:hypothetical protein